MRLLSADKKIENKIDYILSNKKFIFKDVSVLNRFNTGSDHRLVRATIDINTKHERRKLINKMMFPTSDILTQKKDEYQRELRKSLEPI